MKQKKQIVLKCKSVFVWADFITGTCEYCSGGSGGSCYRREKAPCQGCKRHSSRSSVDCGGYGSDRRAFDIYSETDGDTIGKEQKIMEGLGDSVRKLLLAGIGAVATTAEKSKDLLEDLVEKGELTVEQGKVLNEELKHNIKKTVKENVNVSVKPSSPEELDELLEKMSPEQIEILRGRLDALHEKKAEEEGEKEITE